MHIIIKRMIYCNFLSVYIVNLKAVHYIIKRGIHGEILERDKEGYIVRVILREGYVGKFTERYIHYLTIFFDFKNDKKHSSKKI